MKSTMTIIICFFLCGLVGARVLQVPVDYTTIQEGICMAGDGDTVLVAEGEYPESIDFMKKKITIASFFILDQNTSHIEKTIISGAVDRENRSVVYFNNGEDTTSVLAGFTITSGTGTEWYDAQSGDSCLVGGGVYCENSGGMIINNYIVANVIKTNLFAVGAGIFANSNAKERTVIIRDNKIENNLVESERLARSAAISISMNGSIARNMIRNNVCKAGDTMAGPGGIGANEYGKSDIQINILNNDILANQTITDAQIFSFAAGITSFSENVLLINNNIIGNRSSSAFACYAAGIYLNSAKSGSLIKNNRIVNNITESRASMGAGCTLDNCTEIVVDSNIVEGNEGIVGSGIYAYNSEAIIQNNKIMNNSGVLATGIAGYSGLLVIQNNEISDNTAIGYGGGIGFMAVQSALVQNNLIVYNVGNRGAGAGIWKPGGGMLTLDDTFADPISPMLKNNHRLPMNRSDLIPDLGCVVFMNNTICDNEATGRGGGIYVRDWETYFINTVVWGNYSEIDSQIWDENGDLTLYNCDVEEGWYGPGENNLSEDPLFELWSYRLSEISPCLGAGIDSFVVNDLPLACLDFDFCGEPRPQPEGSHPDLGAMEHPSAGGPSTRVANCSDFLPESYTLAQNFPNPFNPVTTIQYSLPEPGRVSLTIYNLQGQLVKTLLDAEQPAGTYNLDWGAVDDSGAFLSSGIYFYHLKVTDPATGALIQNQERKMILLR